ncbi:B-type cyclin [Coemansia sp. RSA 1972]|nr:B-type cyclin [Coemansia sp. RSA 1972]
MDRSTEERRDYLYNNLSKQLTRLNQNFEQLNYNVNVLKTQTEQSQKLAVFHAATSTMAHRSRIPVRRTAAVSDENKTVSAVRVKDTEPVKAVGRVRGPVNAAKTAKPVPKTFGAATRTRSALGDIGNAQVAKLSKPDVAKVQVKPVTKLVPRTNIAKPSVPRARPVASRPTATAVRPSAAVLGARPVTKPTAFGARRPRAVPVAQPDTKRARAAAAPTVLGKHTRSGRDLRAEPAATATSSPNTDSTAVSTTASPLLNETKQDSDFALGEQKFVAQDTLDYALEHTGLAGELPLLMREIDAFEADVDPRDQTLVPEFSDDIFGYMRELEVKLMPDPTYVDRQPAITWATRSILVEWLVQVHQRFNLLPETLYLCVNFVDRFLSTKEILINKLQLVGAVCLLLAAKYEEMHVPSIKDIEYMVEKNYSEEEILRAERYILRMLNFDLGWPGPLSFLRRVSKADDYDMATRTLAKYFIEVTLIDERFVAVPCSQVAACAQYVSLRLLDKGPWSRAHAFYSGYFESELIAHARVLLALLAQPRKHRAIYEKYADRRFLRASEFVHQWLAKNSPEDLLVPMRGDVEPAL